MDKITWDALEQAIKGLINEINPNVRYIPKYGGEVLGLDPKSDTKFVGGIFAYKEHVSLEFSNGAGFNNPEGLLEGKGKHRRYLKYVSLDDIGLKQTKFFLTQALKP